MSVPEQGLNVGGKTIQFHKDDFMLDHAVWYAVMAALTPRPGRDGACPCCSDRPF